MTIKYHGVEYSSEEELRKALSQELCLEEAEEDQQLSERDKDYCFLCDGDGDLEERDDITGEWSLVECWNCMGTGHT